MKIKSWNIIYLYFILLINFFANCKSRVANCVFQLIKIVLAFMYVAEIQHSIRLLSMAQNTEKHFFIFLSSYTYVVGCLAIHCFFIIIILVWTDWLYLTITMMTTTTIARSALWLMLLLLLLLLVYCMSCPVYWVLRFDSTLDYVTTIKPTTNWVEIFIQYNFFYLY